MEFEETPEATAEALVALRKAQGEIAAAVGEIMAGLIAVTGLMQAVTSKVTLIRPLFSQICVVSIQFAEYDS